MAKVLINISDAEYELIVNDEACGLNTLTRAVARGIVLPDDATKEEVFEKLFGMKVDTSADCGFFNCEDKECLDCPIHNKYKDGVCTKDGYKKWWKSLFKEQKDGID